MNDYASFFAAVRATPGDDLTRLVFADWLEENDKDEVCGRCHGRTIDPDETWSVKSGALLKCKACRGSGRNVNHYRQRAAMIRAGCQLAADHRRRLTEGKGAAQPAEVTAALHAEVKSLTRILFPAMHSPEAGEQGVEVYFDRGFIKKVQCPFTWWAERADTLAAEGVGLVVRLTTPPSDAQIESPYRGVFRVAGRTGGCGETECHVKSMEMGHQGSVVPGLFALTWPTVEKWEVPLAHYYHTPAERDAIIRRLEERGAITG